MAEPTLKDVANEALISLIQSASDAMTFLKGEIPVAVRELLTYYTALYVLQAVAMTLLSVAALFWFRGWKKKHDDLRSKPGSTKWGHENHYDGWMFGLASVPAGIAWLISALVLALDVIPDLLKITLAPRIWLIEYAASLVK